MVLFALVTRVIGGATAALLDQDLEQAEEVIESYVGIGARCDDLTRTVKERLSASMLQPNELEYLVAVLQILPALERSAHLGEHIASRTLGHLGERLTPRSEELIRSMSDRVVKMWQDAETAYRKRERTAGFDLHIADDAIDALSGRLVVSAASPCGPPSGPKTPEPPRRSAAVCGGSSPRSAASG